MSAVIVTKSHNIKDKNDFAIRAIIRLFVWKNPGEMWNPCSDCVRRRLNVEYGHAFGHTGSRDMDTFKASPAPDVQVANSAGRVSNVLKINGTLTTGWAFDLRSIIELSSQIQPFLKQRIQLFFEDKRQDTKNYTTNWANKC